MMELDGLEGLAHLLVAWLAACMVHSGTDTVVSEGMDVSFA